MKTSKITLREYLDHIVACKEAIEWVGNRTIEEAVMECHRGDWLLWLASRVLAVDHRKLTLAKGLCANTVRHLMKDEDSVAAVDAAIAYGKGEISREELDTAAAVAAFVGVADADSATASDYAASAAAYAAYSASTAAATYLASAAACGSYAAYAAATASGYADDEATIENQTKTADICREVFGEELIKGINEEL